MAQSLVRTCKSAPFFLFANYMDPHEPYSPPPPFDHVDGPDVPFNRAVAVHGPWQKFYDNYVRTGEGLTPELLAQVSNQYDGELAFTDHWIGDLMESLKAEGVYDDTLIFVLSDHGEFFGEHQLLDHGTGLYEGGIRIPIIVKYPGGAHAGEVIAKRVSIIDIFPTVFEAAGLPVPPSSGQSLANVSHPIVAEEFEDGLRVFRYGEKYRRSLDATYSGDLKLIQSSLGEKELYDLAADPAESANLADVRLDAAAELAAQLSAWDERTQVFNGKAEAAASMSPEMIERLRALGYTGGADPKR
jgi:arylsulfatase A-like enzyme